MCQKPFLQDLKKNFHSISYGIRKSPINAKHPEMQMRKVSDSGYEKLPHEKSHSREEFSPTFMLQESLLWSERWRVPGMDVGKPKRL